jgi:hypothetical protein
MRDHQSNAVRIAETTALIVGAKFTPKRPWQRFCSPPFVLRTWDERNPRQRVVTEQNRRAVTTKLDGIEFIRTSGSVCDVGVGRRFVGNRNHPVFVDDLHVSALGTGSCNSCLGLVYIPFHNNITLIPHLQRHVDLVVITVAQTLRSRTQHLQALSNP